MKGLFKGLFGKAEPVNPVEPPPEDTDDEAEAQVVKKPSLPKGNDQAKGAAEKNGDEGGGRAPSPRPVPSAPRDHAELDGAAGFPSTSTPEIAVDEHGHVLPPPWAPQWALKVAKIQRRRKNGEFYYIVVRNGVSPLQELPKPGQRAKTAYFATIEEAARTHDYFMLDMYPPGEARARGLFVDFGLHQDPEVLALIEPTDPATRWTHFKSSVFQSDTPVIPSQGAAGQEAGQDAENGAGGPKRRYPGRNTVSLYAGTGLYQELLIETALEDEKQRSKKKGKRKSGRTSTAAASDEEEEGRRAIEVTDDEETDWQAFDHSKRSSKKAAAAKKGNRATAPPAAAENALLFVAQEAELQQERQAAAQCTVRLSPPPRTEVDPIKGILASSGPKSTPPLEMPALMPSLLPLHDPAPPETHGLDRLISAIDRRPLDGPESPDDHAGPLTETQQELRSLLRALRGSSPLLPYPRADREEDEEWEEAREGLLALSMAPPAGGSYTGTRLYDRAVMQGLKAFASGIEMELDAGWEQTEGEDAVKPLPSHRAYRGPAPPRTDEEAAHVQCYSSATRAYQAARAALLDAETGLDLLARRQPSHDLPPFTPVPSHLPPGTTHQPSVPRHILEPRHPVTGRPLQAPWNKRFTKAPTPKPLNVRREPPTEGRIIASLPPPPKPKPTPKTKETTEKPVPSAEATPAKTAAPKLQSELLSPKVKEKGERAKTNAKATAPLPPAALPREDSGAEEDDYEQVDDWSDSDEDKALPPGFKARKLASKGAGAGPSSLQPPPRKAPLPSLPKSRNRPPPLDAAAAESMRAYKKKVKYTYEEWEELGLHTLFLEAIRGTPLHKVLPITVHREMACPNLTVEDVSAHFHEYRQRMQGGQGGAGGKRSRAVMRWAKDDLDTDDDEPQPNKKSKPAPHAAASQPLLQHHSSAVVVVEEDGEGQEEEEEEETRPLDPETPISALALAMLKLIAEDERGTIPWSSISEQLMASSGAGAGAGAGATKVEGVKEAPAEDTDSEATEEGGGKGAAGEATATGGAGNPPNLPPKGEEAAPAKAREMVMIAAVPAEERCRSRIWDNGLGTQCKKRMVKGSELQLCTNHAKELAEKGQLRCGWIHEEVDFSADTPFKKEKIGNNRFPFESTDYEGYEAPSKVGITRQQREATKAHPPITQVGIRAARSDLLAAGLVMAVRNKTGHVIAEDPAALKAQKRKIYLRLTKRGVQYLLQTLPDLRITEEALTAASVFKRRAKKPVPAGHHHLGGAGGGGTAGAAVPALHPGPESAAATPVKSVEAAAAPAEGAKAAGAGEAPGAPRASVPPVTGPQVKPSQVLKPARAPGMTEAEAQLHRKVSALMLKVVRGEALRDEDHAVLLLGMAGAVAETRKSAEIALQKVGYTFGPEGVPEGVPPAAPAPVNEAAAAAALQPKVGVKRSRESQGGSVPEPSTGAVKDEPSDSGQGEETGLAPAGREAVEAGPDPSPLTSPSSSEEAAEDEEDTYEPSSGSEDGSEDWAPRAKKRKLKKAVERRGRPLKDKAAREEKARRLAILADAVESPAADAVARNDAEQPATASPAGPEERIRRPRARAPAAQEAPAPAPHVIVIPSSAAQEPARASLLNGDAEAGTAAAEGARRSVRGGDRGTRSENRLQELRESLVLALLNARGHALKWKEAADLIPSVYAWEKKEAKKHLLALGLLEEVGEGPKARLRLTREGIREGAVVARRMGLMVVEEGSAT